MKSWNSFLSSLEDLPKTSPIPRMLCSYLQKQLLDGKLHITLKESVVRFNNKDLDLTKRNQVLKIFEVFVNHQNSNLTRGILIKKVYNEKHESQSHRLQSCHKHNLVKLISRARRLAIKTFVEDFSPNKLQWFPYDSASQTWRLYSINDDFSF